MRLVPQCVPEWPKLAWVASIEDSSESIGVFHGPMVEVTDDWLVEAVWAGDFARGDFDETDLVFGTGIRCRGNHVNFVSSGTVFDRLWHTESEGTRYVSNTLPGLLAIAGLSLRSDYLEYSRDVRSITRGLDASVKSIPTQTADVTAVYFNNLRLSDGQLTEVSKPDLAPHFSRFADYSRFLVATAESLGENLRSPQRRHRIAPLSSISSGYDSSAAAVVSRHAGCTHTVTIKDSSSFWRGSDSGAPVATALGMTCTEYPRTAQEYPLEETVWAATGWPGTLNWTLFDYPDPLCLFFTGCHGEKMWDRVQHDHPDPFVRRDVSSLGFCEYRLSRGVWQCVVPFWGVRRSHEMRSIATADEMAPWTMGKDYDKPIARRIVEEAGVPRNVFGRIKKNSVLVTSIFWPYSPATRSSFRRYLQAHDHYAPSDSLIRLLDQIAHLDNLLYRNALNRLKGRRRTRPWQKLAAPHLLFSWANEELKRRYTQALTCVTVKQESIPARLHQ